MSGAESPDKQQTIVTLGLVSEEQTEDQLALYERHLRSQGYHVPGQRWNPAYSGEVKEHTYLNIMRHLSYAKELHVTLPAWFMIGAALKEGFPGLGTTVKLHHVDENWAANRLAGQAAEVLQVQVEAETAQAASEPDPNATYHLVGLNSNVL